MKKKDARRLLPGTPVRIRFAKEDTFTPMKFDSGVVTTFPIDKDGVLYVDVRLKDGLLVSSVKHLLIKLPKRK